MGERRGLKYVWHTAPRAPDTLFRALASLHPAAVQVLFGRGLTTPEQCQDFLAGVCRDPDDPRLLADLPRAVERLVRARERSELVAVFTDYDADGVNAAAVLATGLRQVGIDPLVRLPNRFVDGYGLTTAAVEELAGKGARVIVTADCGSTAYEAAQRARELGVALLVTDHHHCVEPLPPAHALINPWRLDCRYPCDYLCGAGVAYKLVQALADALLPEGRAAVEHLLDLVAVATVADIMPLVGENRRLVLKGLEIMNAFPRPGVRALLQLSGLTPGEVDATALGFRVAPRVNAAGRLEDPTIAYNLLMADSFEEALTLGEQLSTLNRQRQELSKALEKQACDLAQPKVASGAFSLVVGGERWPGGVVGLVAGRLAQTFHRPSLVFTHQDGQATGSGRSVKDFDLLAALQAIQSSSPIFDRFGGHTMAAGFSLPLDRVSELEQRFEAAARERLKPEQLEPRLQLDGYLKAETITEPFAAMLRQLAPFGNGFTMPTFGALNLQIMHSRRVGADMQTWQVRLRPDKSALPVQAVYFQHGHLADQLPVGSRLHAAFKLNHSVWQGRARAELELLDVAPA